MLFSNLNTNESYQAKLDNLDLSSAMINEPSSFESLDSKSRMLLINLPLGKIDNEPGGQVKIVSSVNDQQMINEDIIDMTDYLKWSLIKKSNLGDIMTTLEPSETSGVSSSDFSSAILDINNLLKLTQLVPATEPIHSDHLTTPMIDPWLHEVQINDDAKVIQPEK
jgi:hypothetical protein